MTGFQHVMVKPFRVKGIRATTRLTSVRAVANVIEKRYFDVAIVGDGTLAQSTAAAIASKGRRVVLIGSFHGSLRAKPVIAAPRKRHLRLLLEDATSIELAKEALYHWKSLEEFAGGVFDDVGSLDVGPSNTSEAGATLGRLNDLQSTLMCASDALTPQTIQDIFPSLRLQAGQLALWNREGGLIDARNAAGALASFAAKSGADVRTTWDLHGWQDQGSYFRLRIRPSTNTGFSSKPVPTSQSGPSAATSRDGMPVAPTDREIITGEESDDESWLEVEQLLLAPSRHILDSLQLFQATCNLTVKQAVFSTLPTSAATAASPAIRVLYQPSQQAKDAGYAEMGSGVLLSSHADVPGCLLQQPPAFGAALPPSGKTADEKPDQEWLNGAIQRVKLLAPKLLPGEDGQTTRGGRLQKEDSVVDLYAGRLRVSQHTMTDDGLPVVGWHTGMEEGRVCVAIGSSGGTCGGFDGYQNNLALGRIAADMIASNCACPYTNLSLQRASMKWMPKDLGLDSWQELSLLLGQAAPEEF